MPELTETSTTEEFQAFLGQRFKVLKGQYAGKHGILLGCMESDIELALECENETVFPLIDEIDPKPVLQ